MDSSLQIFNQEPINEVKQYIDIPNSKYPPSYDTCSQSQQFTSNKDNGSISSNKTSDTTYSAYSFNSSFDDSSERDLDEEMTENLSNLDRDEYNRILKMEKSRSSREKIKESLNELKETIPNLEKKTRISTPQLIKETVKHILSLNSALKNSKEAQISQLAEIEELKKNLLEKKFLLFQSEQKISNFIQKKQQEFCMNNPNLPDMEKTLQLLILNQNLQLALYGTLQGINLNGIYNNANVVTGNSGIPANFSTTMPTFTSPMNSLFLNSMTSIPMPQQEQQSSLQFSTQQFPLHQKLESSQKQLPEGWEEFTDNFGRKFFVNHIDKTTTWLDPRRIVSKN